MKRYKVIFSSKALNDIENAVDYYNLQQKGLGKKFVKHTQAALQSIRTNPEYAAIRYEHIRCAIVPKFPFLVHYSFETATKTITILAVFNTSLEPLW